MDGKRVAQVKIQRVRSPESETSLPAEALLQSAKELKSSSRDS